jgi:C-terminal processing protease CtpA/Prc
MVAAFAAENHLARIVGTATPGRLVGSKPFKLRYGYFLILPVGAYVTWQGKRLEGEGIKPHAEVPLAYEAVAKGQDNQLDAAIAMVKSM